MSEATNMGKEVEVGKEALGQNPVVLLSTDKVDSQYLSKIVEDLKTRDIPVGVKNLDYPAELYLSAPHQVTLENGFPKDIVPEELRANRLKLGQELNDEYGDLSKAIIIHLGIRDGRLVQSMQAVGFNEIIPFPGYYPKPKWDESPEPKNFEEAMDMLTKKIDESRERLNPVIDREHEKPIQPEQPQGNGLRSRISNLFRGK